MNSLPAEDSLYQRIRSEGSTRELAFEEFRKRLFQAVTPKFKAMYGLDEQFSEDIVQETMVVVLEKIDGFRGNSNFFTWALSISVRLALGEIRRKRWKDCSLDELTAEASFEVPSNNADFTKALETEEEFTIIRNAIENILTEKQRTALLAELEGMQTSEIARRYQTTNGAIYKLTYDARKALVQHFRKIGFSLEEQK